MFSGDKDKQPRKVWDNPDMQPLINEALSTTDAARRQPLFDRLHTQMLADVPAIWLYNNAAISVTGPRVASYAGWVTEQPRFWAVKLK
jgi:peptide/nickel transport system substrate-binding protein